MRSTIPALRRAMGRRGERAFRGFVRRSGDTRLERTAGSPLGLRMLFGAMARRYAPERAGGFTGDIQYDLRTEAGEVRSWTVSVAGGAATARPGAAAAPALKVKLGVADFLRIASRDLDPGSAMLSGRLDLEGDFGVATRLGEMFGMPGAF